VLQGTVVCLLCPLIPANNDPPSLETVQTWYAAHKIHVTLAVLNAQMCMYIVRAHVTSGHYLPGFKHVKKLNQHQGQSASKVILSFAHALRLSKKPASPEFRQLCAYQA